MRLPLTAIVGLSLATACVHEPTSRTPTPNLAALSDTGETDSAAPVVAAKDTEYAPAGKRDPFVGETMASPPTPDLSGLRLVFTNTGSSSPLAVVVDDHNRDHTVHVGDFLGKDWGRVSAIHREDITITQLYAGNDRQVFSHDVTLRMPKDSAPLKLTDGQ